MKAAVAVVLSIAAAPLPAQDDVSGLGSPDWAVRVAARDRLLVRGRAALPEVLAALDDPDPEIRHAAEDLLPLVRWNIGPSLDVKVGERAAAFDACRTEERIEFLYDVHRVAAEEAQPFLETVLAFEEDPPVLAVAVEIQWERSRAVLARRLAERIQRGDDRSDLYRHLAFCWSTIPPEHRCLRDVEAIAARLRDRVPSPLNASDLASWAEILRWPLPSVKSEPRREWLGHSPPHDGIRPLRVDPPTLDPDREPRTRRGFRQPEGDYRCALLVSNRFAHGAPIPEDWPPRWIPIVVDAPDDDPGFLLYWFARRQVERAGTLEWHQEAIHRRAADLARAPGTLERALEFADALGPEMREPVRDEILRQAGQRRSGT